MAPCPVFRFYDYWEVTKANCKTGKPQKYIVLVTELMTSGNSPPPTILYFFSSFVVMCPMTVM
jgi:hypothetical protein